MLKTRFPKPRDTTYRKEWYVQIQESKRKMDDAIKLSKLLYTHTKKYLSNNAFLIRLKTSLQTKWMNYISFIKRFLCRSIKFYNLVNQRGATSPRATKVGELCQCWLCVCYSSVDCAYVTVVLIVCMLQ